jgi:hypothetical protein
MSEPDSTLRASDADREEVVEQLRRHAAEGRLDTGELELRVQAALAARTLGELEPLLRDLPARVPPRPRARAARPELRSLLGLAVLLVSIWALTGMGYFWPVWPLLGVGYFSFACGRRGGRARGARRAPSARGLA